MAKPEIKDPLMKDWFEKAMAWGKAHNSFTEIKRGSEQHKAWIAYFNGLGIMPFTLRNIDYNKEHSWTAPCEWPNDIEYKPSPFLLAARPQPRLIGR